MRERVASWAKYIARSVIRSLLDDPAFRRMLREIVLSVVCEQEHQRTAGIMEVFFDCCKTAGVEPKVENDRLVFGNPNGLGPELQQVVMLYRREIKERVEVLKRMAARDEHRTNGKPCSPERMTETCTTPRERSANE